LPIEAPLHLQAPDSKKWDHECDVLVVGFGAAGACAAIEAARAGASVVIVDRFGGGGASARSGGVVYAGGGTAQQKNAGYNDTPEAMYEYLRREVEDAVSEPTLRRFCSESTTMITWLESLGVEFGSTVPPHKTSYPADGYYLYYSGNEAVKEYAGRNPPAPRGHRVKGKGLSGANLFKVLRRAVIAAGAHVMTQASVRRLVVDDASGAVVGAEVRQLVPDSTESRRHRKLSRWADNLHYAAPGRAAKVRERVVALELDAAKPLLVRARRAVVLSTGGFIFNHEMVQRHAPQYSRNWPLGTAGCDGSGIRLGQSVGGEGARLERVSAWRFINPPFAWVRGMVVDESGRRFCNEEVYGARLGHEMCEHHQGKAWLVIDSAIRREGLREALFGGLWAFQCIPLLVQSFVAFKRGRTIEDLARRLAMHADELRQAWLTYNACARGEHEDPFGKSTQMMKPLEGPFYALDISVDRRIFPCAAITLGGLRVDENTGAVRTADGGIVEGLYAAGRAAIGVASNHYVSGLALADCVWSGRRAGRSAAQSAHEAAGAKRATA
jgi:3-oxo-5alpha-steroid 4-dehydrogenase